MDMLDVMLIPKDLANVPSSVPGYYLYAPPNILILTIKGSSNIFLNKINQNSNNEIRNH